jgi:hypothetical protein
VWIGSGLTMRLPVGVMRATLAIVLVAAGLALLQKADLGLSPEVVIGAPLLIAAVAWLVRSLRSRPPFAVPENA